MKFEGSDAVSFSNVLLLLWGGAFVTYIVRAARIIRTAFAVAKRYQIPTRNLEFWALVVVKAFLGIPVVWPAKEAKHFGLIATTGAKSRTMETLLDNFRTGAKTGRPIFVALDNNSATFHDRQMFYRWMSEQTKATFKTRIIPIVEQSVKGWEHSGVQKEEIVKLVVQVFQAVGFGNKRPLPWNKVTKYMHIFMYRRFIGPLSWLPVVLPWTHNFTTMAAQLRGQEDYVNFHMLEELRIQKELHEAGATVLYTYWSQNTKRDKDSEYEFCKFAYQCFAPNLASSSFNIFFLLFFMAKHQEFQEKAFKEVHIKTSGDPNNLTLQLLQDLKTVCAFTSEVLRFMGPIRGQARVIEGIDISVDIREIHRDSRYFKDPNVFIPDRFMDETQQQNPAFRPFGYGPRMCPAQIYALVFYRTTLAAVLVNYKLDLAPGSLNVSLKDLKYAHTPIGYWAGGDEWLELGKHLVISKRYSA